MQHYKTKRRLCSVYYRQPTQISSVYMEKFPFVSTKEDTVDISCLCRTPWIEGTTSKAIYGDKQKLFNMHICCKCNNWYHYHCLTICKISKPKIRGESNSPTAKLFVYNCFFVCPNCKIPDTIQWGRTYFNTCTSDNILTILLLHCHENPTFIHQFNSSETENALRSGVMIMLEGNLENGKTVILDYIHSVISLNNNGEKYDCHGTEYGMFLCVYHHVWKFAVLRNCTSPHCP